MATSQNAPTKTGSRIVVLPLTPEEEAVTSYPFPVAPRLARASSLLQFSCYKANLTNAVPFISAPWNRSLVPCVLYLNELAFLAGKAHVPANPLHQKARNSVPAKIISFP